MERTLADADAEIGRQGEAARAAEARSGQLEAAFGQARQGCIERDRRIAWLEAELDLARADATSGLRRLAALGAELEELRVTARGQATRIRLEALREAVAVSERLGELDAAPEDSFDRLLRAVEAAIGRLGGPAEGESTEHADAPVAVPSEASRDGEPAAGVDDAPGPPSANGGGRRVSVDIGPFSDFSQLVSFEDAANAIGGTGEISIRRFSGGRASIDVDLSEPVDLLRELEQRCELEFRVRARSDDEIILDLGE